MSNINKFRDAFKNVKTSYEARSLYYALDDTCKNEAERDLLYESFWPIFSDLSHKELDYSFSHGLLTEYTTEPIM